MTAWASCVRSSRQCLSHSSASTHRIECAIDEAMVRFKGRSSLKQYVPKKPVRRGFKLWVRADSHNGFISDFQVYTGKDDEATTQLGRKVVERLSRSLIGGGFHLYFDNFFSSLPLFDSLSSDGLYACGTFRRDRKGIPDEITSVKPGQHIYASYLADAVVPHKHKVSIHMYVDEMHVHVQLMTCIQENKI